MSWGDVWWMENGSELCDELTKERDEARAERDGLRALCDRIREARNDPRHDFGHVPKGGCDKIEWTEETGHYETNLPCSCGHDALTAAIEALGPGGTP